MSTQLNVVGQVKQVLHGKDIKVVISGNKNDDKSLGKIFKSHKLYQLNGSLVKRNKLTADKFSKVQLVFGDEYDWELALEEYDLRENHYIRRVIRETGIEESNGNGIVTYRGYANGNQSHKVRISSINGQLTGVILQGEEEIFFEPASKYLSTIDTNAYILYKGSDIIAESEVKCGMAEVKETLQDIERDQIQYATAATGCVEVEIAIAADYSLVLQQGSVDAAETRIINILNLVNGFYSPAPLEIEYKLSETFFSTATASDPWSTTTDANTLLTSFRTWGNGGGFKKPFDVATLWTKRDIGANGNNGVVGVASIGAVCNAQKYNVVEHFSTNIKMVAIDQSHELGHNWNCQHVTGNTYIMSPTLTTTTTTWDETSINSIINWKSKQSCFTACGPKLPIADFSSDVTTSCSGDVKFTDLSLFTPSSYKWEFGDGTTSTEKSPSHRYGKNGSYTVKLSVTNSLGTDVITKTNYINVAILAAPVVGNVEICGAGPANLSSKADNSPNTLQWYTAASGGEPVFVGNTFTPTVSQTTTYYVENSNVGPIQKVGPVDNAFSDGAYFNANDLRGLIFDVLAPVKLKSVKVYANSAGNRTIQVMDSVNGKQVVSKTVDIPSGESRVALDFNLPAHLAYHIKVSGTVNLFRNTSGAKYPYVIPNVVSISETDVSTINPGYYYYFYDWEVQRGGCSTVRVPVTVTVNCLTEVANSLDEQSLKIFPNPVTESLSIELKGGNANIELIDLLGNVVYFSFEWGADNISKNIDISQLSKGIYFLNIAQANKKTVRKIVKQ
jgi:PKD repeat protein